MNLKIISVSLLIIIVLFLLKSSKTKDSHEVITEKDELAMKNKEILKDKIQNDLKKNKIQRVFVSTHSKKYHYKSCRFYNENTMKEIPLDIAKKEGYTPCKICNKKTISA